MIAISLGPHGKQKSSQDHDHVRPISGERQEHIATELHVASKKPAGPHAENAADSKFLIGEDSKRPLRPELASRKPEVQKKSSVLAQLPLSKQAKSVNFEDDNQDFFDQLSMNSGLSADPLPATQPKDPINFKPIGDLFPSN
jgi:hypothetical protein